MGRVVNTLVECTLPEKILLAAYQLEEEGQTPFSAEALIVAAWQKYPRTFGLKGYAEQFPDSNKVLASIMGGRGIAKRGWLVKVGQKLYSLSRDGRQLVRRLLTDGDSTRSEESAGGEAVKLTSDQEKLLNRLLESSAYGKFREGRKTELTFADACRFWNITESQSGEILDARLEHVQAGLAILERDSASGSLVLSNGREVDAKELEKIGDLNDYLHQRFDRHLTLLRHRSDKK
jgi:hypothetical protein